MNYRTITAGTLLASSLVLLAIIPGPLVSSQLPGRQAAPAAQSSGGAQNVSPAARDALTTLQSAAPGEVVTQVSRSSGMFTFVRSAQGQPLVSDDASAPPQRRASSFLAAHGGLLGMNEAERGAIAAGAAPERGSELRVAKTETDAIGFTHVRFHQTYKGVPVFGVQVIVHMNGAGITAVNGDFVPDIAVSTIPEVSAERAAELAMLAVRKTSGADDLKADKTELAVYPAGLLQGQPVIARLAHGVEVSGTKAKEQVWIDAQSGTVLASIPQHHTALNRTIYSPNYDPQNPNLFVQRKEGDPPHPTPFVNNLYDFAGHTYNFYASAFGRDSYDGKGHKMISVYLINEACPNAYWNGESTNYCPAFDADDVVSHEWSHAYTEFTHDLIYAYQSGALNEAYSDIFGEGVDLLNNADGIGGNNNSKPYPAGQRWLVGEDLGEEAQTLLLRDMYDPDRLGDPGKVSSENYACGNSDGGGVHTNSGVPNHAFALIVDGTQYKPADADIKQAAGTYNGHTITGIGLTKASAIYFRAESVYQTPSTTFAQHDTAIQTSCSDLIGAPLNNLSTTTAASSPAAEVISAADCAEVAKTMIAVEMSMVPRCNFGPVFNSDPAPLCAGAQTIYSEDWETGEDGWTKTSQGGGIGTGATDWEQQPSKNNTRFFKLKSDLPGGRSGTAAFADDPQLNEEGGGTCRPGGDYSGSHSLDSPSITIPAGANAPMLVFDHWFATEVGVDGGQVEISTDGGLTWTLVPKSAYLYNGPNNAFNEVPPLGNNTNPNPNEDAWTGFNIGLPDIGSWGTTIADLSSFAGPGDRIKVRFLWSQDGCNGVVGWYIDNIKVVNCPVLTGPVLSTGAGYQNPDPDGSFELTWTRPTDASGPDTLQEATVCGASFTDPADEPLVAGTNSRWSGSQQWTTQVHPETGSPSYYIPNGASQNESLTMRGTVTVPNDANTTLTFTTTQGLENSYDFGYVEASTDGGKTYTALAEYTGPGGLEPTAAFSGTRRIDLTSFAGQTIKLRFRVDTDSYNIGQQIGWYIENITVTSENWEDVATVEGTSRKLAKASGSYCYRVRTTYTFGADLVPSLFSNILKVQVAGGVFEPARLQNISARARVQNGDNVLIGGFIITDTPKRVIVRGIGPSLQSGGAAVPGRMTDPMLELYQGGNPVPVGVNDDWQTNQAEVEGTNLAPTDPREPAIVATLDPGTYTSIMYGKNGEVGIGLVEIYDLDAPSSDAAPLRNLSARAFVESDDNVLIGGFIAGPEQSGNTRVVVRAIGPSLQSQLPDALDDTTLEVVDGNGSRTTNDDWEQSPDAAQIQQAGLAPSDRRESAVMLPATSAGLYTAIVRGKGRPRGVGVVEIYNLQ